MRNTSIVILTYNNLQYNKVCIESIRKMTPEGSYELIVVDNNSTDGTAAWLEEQSDIKLILNDENKGFPAGCNQGINAAEQENDILLLNNDTIVTPNWLDNLRNCLYSDDSIGAVGPITNSCSNLQAIDTNYKDFNEMITFAKALNISDPSKWEERIRLIGFCILIRNEVVRKTGLLDEIYGMGNFEDDDYSLRIRKNGYKLMLCYDCFIYHFGGKSFNAESKKYGEILEANRKTFADKWGVDPYLFAIDERILLDPYIDKLKKAKEILVLNSGCGSMLLYLKKIMPQCKLTAVEENERLSIGCSDAAELYSSFEAVQGRKFDLVIILSALRGDLDLSAQIEKLPAILTADGSILFTSDRQNYRELLSRPCFDAFSKTITPNVAFLQRLPDVKVNVMSGKDLLNMDFSLTAEVSPEKQLAFILRRLENGIDEESNTKTLESLLGSTNYSKTEIEKIINNSVINKTMTLNSVGGFYYNEGKKQQALELFVDGYALNKKYRDCAFNLAYTLLEAKDKKMALEVIDRCGATDDEMMQLKQAALDIL